MNNKFEIKSFEELMRQNFLSLQKDPKDQVFEAASYSLFSGGKRLRPQLLQMSFQFFSDDSVEVCRPFQYAIEMIHSYSLIHDDLPAMDNDILRRGKPSCHIAFGEAIAILAGDLLLNSAYETMVEACLDQADQASLKAMHLIARAAGNRGMILGQSRDVTFEDKDHISEEELVEMLSLKTAAIIEASLSAGAVLAGCTEEEASLIRLFGQHLGLAFQIRDDLLDTLSSSEELGKSSGKDLRDQKKTYVTVLGKDAAIKKLSELSEKAILLLFKLESISGRDSKELRLLTEKLETRLS